MFISYLCHKNKKILNDMKALLFLILVVLCICLDSHQGNELKSLEMNQLFLSNVEALANNEGVNFFCYGEGDIDCHGMKVEFKVQGVSLDY